VVLQLRRIRLKNEILEKFAIIPALNEKFAIVFGQLGRINPLENTLQ
jgi:hypothetical protein